MGKIIGIGTDLIEIRRVCQAYARESFQRKYFTERERELIQKRPSRAATAFAGKEAVVKAMGTGFRGILPSEIEILREPDGAPCVRLSGQAAEQAERLGVNKVHISLTDTEELAMAYVVMEDSGIS